MNAATQIAYGHVVEVDLPFDRALATMRAALEDEGFHITNEIDMAEAAKEKPGETFRPYVILGACNSQLARLVLSAEPQLGLLMPCNIVIQEIEGRTVVSVIDASAIVKFAGNKALQHVAEVANERLLRALKTLTHKNR